MKFEEIFKNEGLYRTDTFGEGIAFKIKKGAIGLDLYTVEYKNKDDINPLEYSTNVYSNLFNKDYEKVFNRNQLFKQK